MLNLSEIPAIPTILSRSYPIPDGVAFLYVAKLPLGILDAWILRRRFMAIQVESHVPRENLKKEKVSKQAAHVIH